jgi:subtilisin family serine protease
MVLAAGTVGLLGIPQAATTQTTALAVRTDGGSGKQSKGATDIGPAAEVRKAGPVHGDGQPELSYVVNGKTDAGTIRTVKKAIAKAGGSVVATHSRIGVIVARSANADFASTMRRVKGVQSAGVTRTAPLTPVGGDVGKPEKVRAPRSSAARAAKHEPLESMQWNIAAIRADKAAAKAAKSTKSTKGSRKVTVAVIDSGVDDTHPDLKDNFSAQQSANCAGGVADTAKGAWRPYTEDDYHGTHVAGIIGAARDGTGVAGVAPGVRIASIKVSERTGLYYGEAVVCALMFAADHSVEVTNNSYYIDPWMFNCENDPDQAAVVEAVDRAAKFAESKGIVHVAAAGNSNFDLAAKSITDTSSPNDSTPITRKIDPSVCLDLPAQLPGVVTVSATGPGALKSVYSNYGLNQIDVAAPGGDESRTAESPAKDSRILSTMPGGEYAYLQGTSMAAPHASGVIALIKSKHPKASSRDIQWRIKAQADNPGCPSASSDSDSADKAQAKCTGSEQVNSFYGFGIVDALDAVTE